MSGTTEKQRVNIKQLFRNVSAQLNLKFKETEQTLNFPLDRGGEREEAIRQFLVKTLPRRYGISKGFVVSHKGIQSNQCDIIIYDAETSPIFYKDVSQEIFPIEAVYSVIQVKSKLGKKELQDAIQNIKLYKQVPRNDVTTTGIGIEIRYNRPVNPKFGVLVAYSLGKEFEQKNQNEIQAELIKEIEKEKPSERIDLICIIDRGIIMPVKVRKEDNVHFISFFEEDAPFLMVGDSKESMGLFFVALLHALNNIKLEQPNLFDYFNQQ